ncbi:MAG: N-acetylmuramoyl-L-alanine amidase [Verrucomicrobia bacterium]|nr:N-acetylmuramoyl-L-alanine amidase [Verrucomicrobiota bacterium]
MEVFDPFHALGPFLQITDSSVRVFAAPGRDELVEVRFASSPQQAKRPPVTFRTVSEISRRSAFKPLAGLRLVIEPADIGGKWGGWDDRSTFYRGYGRIQEGDLNLTVAKLLQQNLRQLGAKVFLTRSSAEPVATYDPHRLDEETREILARQIYTMPPAFYERTRNVPKNSERWFAIAKEVLFAKVIEQRSRAAKVRRYFKPDLTIVLQHDASPESARGGLVAFNRNIFFVSGAYQARELKTDPHQRLRLLSKLFENVTPTETAVAVRIAARFRAVTGDPPVRYGNSANTRTVPGGNAYVVARNLAFNREHDGPVVVTEPYFMNEPVTLQRLVAGDYRGTRIVAGRPRESIFREYANNVTAGLADAYRQTAKTD